MSFEGSILERSGGRWTPINFQFWRGSTFFTFSKTPLSASKQQFLYKISTFSHFLSFRGKNAVLRHLEVFFLKG